MSQRGGSVDATVCFGPGSTALVSRAEADVVLAFEPLEALRALARMSPRTLVLINERPVVPFSLTLQGESYPGLDSILVRIAEVTRRIEVVDGSKAADGCGAPRSLNVTMLGALTAFDGLPFGSETLRAAVAATGRAEVRDANLRAFDAGRELGRTCSLAASRRSEGGW